MNSFMRLLLVFLISVVPNETIAEPVKVALTFDDLPYVWEVPPRGFTNKSLIQDIIAVLANHNIKGVFAFVNGGKTDDPTSREILDLWVKNGHFFGNHTWSHPDLNALSSTEYIANIEKNHAFLKAYGNSFLSYFRYPFLHEGNTQEKRTSVRNHLRQSGYRIAQVTIDHNDWEWYAPMDRCLKKKDSKKITWLRDSYLSEARENLKAAKLMSQFLFGRQIKHIALFHPNVVSVELLDQLLANWAAEGVQFISLQDAMTDAAYDTDPDVVHKSPNIFTNQIRLMRGLKNPPDVLQIYQATEKVEKMLEKTCR